MRSPAIPDGRRIYAIGDVHGRADLLDVLLRQIECDNALRVRAIVTVILLGDIIDRGPYAAPLLSTLSSHMQPGLICLRGNHEAAMVDAWKGNRTALRMWLRHGGTATLSGFGVTKAALAGTEEDQLAALLANVPPSIIDWMSRLPLRYPCGDYLFVHAGVRPGIALTQQTAQDQLWIRDEFLTSKRWHGKRIVHGHTPSKEVEILPNRIGVDTGAYTSERLSAVGLEGTESWVIQT
ncbi:serine/threonine protein phosphatase 1 [Sphingomonas prati]|uniref:Serine/threonine protein phosphatase 1 n=2 Tax=Sphingomonas prati TaxID=1843237 RepID=A0A7W9F0F8_9SPHN|nr:metallophosphoesterase [Sphingomonas prati]MBB5728296.1 serine/threonine protein phosphatase 1 [Sphingomonas prati]